MQLKHNSVLRQNTVGHVWGWFDPYALLVSVYAPTREVLESTFPLPPEEALKRGLLSEGYYSVPDDWSGLLYAANFVHEATHYWQYASRPVLITAYSTFTLQAKYTHHLMRTLRREPALPPRLPLLRLVAQADSQSPIRDWLKYWGGLETGLCGLLGFDFSPAGNYFRGTFEAFRKIQPLPHLPKKLFPEIVSVVHDNEELTLRLLLENEAFGNEFDLIWSLYGSDVACKIGQLLYGDRTPLEYGGLFLSTDGPVHLYPLAMELAMSSDLKGDFKADHPCWRFVAIAQALRETNRWKSQKDATENLREVLEFLEGKIGIGPIDGSFQKSLDYVMDSQKHFLPNTRALLAECLRVKLRHFPWFAFPNIYIWDIMQTLPLPFVAFRSEPEKYSIFGQVPVSIDLHKLIEELWFVASARELALWTTATCPICTRLIAESRPSRCSGTCRWAKWFTSTWGWHPHELEST